jgi:hypothetical protein
METLVNNILSVYNVATEQEKADGINWYNDARAICKRLADKYEQSFQTVCYVMAALSPNNKWQRNITDTERVLTLYSSGELRKRVFNYSNGDKEALKNIACTYTANLLKANAILETGDITFLKGLKVNNFAQNIHCPNNDAVTIDYHAISIALGIRHTIETVKSVNYKGKNYEKFVTAYRIASEKVGLKPFELQAITWGTWRNLDKVK